MPEAINSIAKRILQLFDELDRENIDLHSLVELVGGNLPADREAVLDAIAELTSQGLFRVGEGSEFYERTEDGRLALAGPREVTLYTRAGCHLCEEAKVAMAVPLREFSVTMREVDIDRDPVLRERYKNDVPVVFLGAKKIAKHRVDPAAFRRRLEQCFR
jgi:glutaredoxin